ncbi:MAG: hypothetical protein Q8P20_05190 [bacterium]|nr:hypothetical protein [bacterium]MDZ4228366.1 hypothetical protein [Candidatus Levybacteria bacterium]
MRERIGFKGEIERRFVVHDSEGNIIKVFNNQKEADEFANRPGNENYSVSGTNTLESRELN